MNWIIKVDNLLEDLDSKFDDMTTQFFDRSESSIRVLRDLLTSHVSFV